MTPPGSKADTLLKAIRTHSAEQGAALLKLGSMAGLVEEIQIQELSLRRQLKAVTQGLTIALDTLSKIESLTMTQPDFPSKTCEIVAGMASRASADIRAIVQPQRGKEA